MLVSNPGIPAVRGVRTTAEITTEPLQLTVAFDPNAWWQSVDFTRLAELDDGSGLVILGPDDPDYSALIIAMTANVMSGDRERTLAAGMQDHIGKPIDIRELFSALERWLSSRWRRTLLVLLLALLATEADDLKILSCRPSETRESSEHCLQVAYTAIVCNNVLFVVECSQY